MRAARLFVVRKLAFQWIFLEGIILAVSAAGHRSNTGIHSLTSIRSRSDGTTTKQFARACSHVAGPARHQLPCDCSNSRTAAPARTADPVFLWIALFSLACVNMTGRAVIPARASTIGLAK